MVKLVVGWSIAGDPHMSPCDLVWNILTYSGEVTRIVPDFLPVTAHLPIGRVVSHAGVKDPGKEGEQA